MDIIKLLEIGIKNNASDIHLSPNQRLALRIHGQMTFLDDIFLKPNIIQDIFDPVMTDPQKEILARTGELDFSFSGCRIHLFRQLHGIAAAIRIIPSLIPTLEQLGLARHKKLLDLSDGLILVTGATGSGKSTTLASMIDSINSTKSAHIVTIEDPIEFHHVSKKSLINQRQVYRDTKNFLVALHAALREDPDVIMIGELRDIESIRMALLAATTGHLVLSTLHTNSAVQTIQRIIDTFPSEEKNSIKGTLAESLQAIISQTLANEISGKRVAAFEIMIATPAIKNLIREEKFSQVYSAIQMGGHIGMCTLEESLKRLSLIS